MKKILLLLILFPVVCFSQKKDTLKSKWTTATHIQYRVQNGDTTWYSQKGAQIPKLADVSKWTEAIPTNRTSVYDGITFHSAQTNTPKQDTIPVIMLVCDTSGNTSFSKRKVSETTYLMERRTTDGLWWQFGYAVQESINTQTWYPNYYVEYSPSGFPFITKEYLDQNRKPLPKSIVVWMSKETNHIVDIIKGN